MSTNDSEFFRTMSLVMAALGIFFVVIVVAALMITDSGDDAKVSTDPRIAAKVEELIQPVGEVNVETAAAAAPATASAAPAAGGGASDTHAGLGTEMLSSQATIGQ